MARSKLRPHAGVHHEDGGRHLDILDFDPIRGLIVVGTFVASTFAATWITYGRVRCLLGVS